MSDVCSVRICSLDHALLGESLRLRRELYSLHFRKDFAAELLHGLDPEQGAVLFFREHVKQAVRTLAYIADPLP
jgi:hypothetical protein